MACTTTSVRGFDHSFGTPSNQRYNSSLASVSDLKQRQRPPALVAVVASKASKPARDGRDRRAPITTRHPRGCRHEAPLAAISIICQTQPRGANLQCMSLACQNPRNQRISRRQFGTNLRPTMQTPSDNRRASIPLPDRSCGPRGWMIDVSTSPARWRQRNSKLRMVQTFRQRSPSRLAKIRDQAHCCPVRRLARVKRLERTKPGRLRTADCRPHTIQTHIFSTLGDRSHRHSIIALFLRAWQPLPLVFSRRNLPRLASSSADVDAAIKALQPEASLWIGGAIRGKRLYDGEIAQRRVARDPLGQSRALASPCPS